jgi:hypothetical protein
MQFIIFLRSVCITNIQQRGSLPPTIAVAWYQSNDIAEIYTTLGYLVPVISVLSMVSVSRLRPLGS